MTKVYFVRHAQPIFSHVDDTTRPLSEQGLKDRKIVVETLKDKEINGFYCSPYKRSLDTIEQTAKFFNQEIKTDMRLRERDKGPDGKSNNPVMFQKRWIDHTYHEEGGESIEMVQNRNIAALHEILEKNEDKNIVIGTHGTALSTIINYYKPEFGCDDFLRIINWMPFILEMDFDGLNLVSMVELAYVEKEFKQ